MLCFLDTKMSVSFWAPDKSGSGIPNKYFLFQTPCCSLWVLNETILIRTRIWDLSYSYWLCILKSEITLFPHICSSDFI